jgi:hypothetical protein
MSKRNRQRIAPITAELEAAMLTAMASVPVGPGEPLPPASGARRVGPPPRTVRTVTVDPGYPEQWRKRLNEIAAKQRRLHAEERVLVAQAIAAGATWSAIARELGVTRQSAHRRFRNVVGQVGQGVEKAPI